MGAKMLVPLSFFVVLSSFLVQPTASKSANHCSNGRQALWAWDISTSQFSPRCAHPGQACRHKTGKCSDRYLCCPRTLRMFSKGRVVDRVTDMVFQRVGEDFRDAYRMFELTLLSNDQGYYHQHARWLFLDETLRDLFEMPDARFWYSIIDCMQNQGMIYALVPLNATSITANISAMTMLTRKNNSPDSLYVCYMATRKEHRRRGLATRLLQQIVQRALDEQKSGVRNVIMHVNTLNLVALDLYERCGWRCYAYLPGYLQYDPHHLTNHAYALILQLDYVKNVTMLCRKAKAIEVQPFADEQSIRHCGRTPIHFQW